MACRKAAVSAARLPARFCGDAIAVLGGGEDQAHSVVSTVPAEAAVITTADDSQRRRPWRRGSDRTLRARSSVVAMPAAIAAVIIVVASAGASDHMDSWCHRGFGGRRDQSASIGRCGRLKRLGL